MPKVALCVLAEDNDANLKLALKALRAVTYPAEALRPLLANVSGRPQMADRLAVIARREGLSLVQPDSAGGPAAIAAIAGLASDCDVIVICAGDTAVAPELVGRLVEAMQCHADIGLAGPLSNFAGWQSVPRGRSPMGKWTYNRMPRGMKLPAFEDALADINRERMAPRVPIVEGFCLAIRTDVFGTIGHPRRDLAWEGAGAIDFCFRASDAGFGIAVVPNTVAYRHNPPKPKHKGRPTEPVTVPGYPLDRVERVDDTLRNNPLLADIRDAAAKLSESARRAAVADADG